VDLNTKKMKFNGTKKEWFNDEPSSTRLDGKLINACDVANEDGKYVATVYGNTPKVCKANANLITSAPEMIKSLIKIKTELGKNETQGGWGLDDIYKMVDETIKKALGK
jgi:hypothetical protein